MAIAEVNGNPEVGQTFYGAGPARTKESLMRFFSRPDTFVQFRLTVTADGLTTHLPNCLIGYHVKYLFCDNLHERKIDTRQAVSEALSLFSAE